MVLAQDMKRMSCTLTRLCLLHDSNSAIMLLFGIITHHASGSFVLNVTVPLRGSPVRANCTLPGSAVGVSILFNSLGTLQEPAQCRPDLNRCVPSSYPNMGLVFYYLSAGSNSAWIDILSLDRIRDQAIWRCLLGNQTTLGTVNLTVFTSPKGVKYAQPILLDGDLGQESVTLICETVNCSYPSPQISWYYLTAEQELAQYSETDGTIVNNTSLCDQLEAIYTSTLHLTRGTTFKGNIDFTTKFACGVRHPALDVDISYSNLSNYIKFAVNLTSVTLKDMNGSYLPSMVELVEGSVVTLNCVTSTSRPTATVRWYIGKTNIISGIENVVRPGGSGLQYIESKLTFTPSNAEYHNKSIYCQAYSYLNYSVIQSTQHTLFVKVNVTQAELKQSNRTVEDILSVTSWEPVTLMCVTGFSRPAPIINWYIESQWKGNGTSLIFTASNEDHNKTIYCSAYNIDPSRPAYSGKPRLYVKVSVRVISLESSTNGTFVFYDGFSQRLKCTGNPSRPLPTIKWMLESQAETVPLTDNITNTDVTDVDGLYVWTSEITHIVRKDDQNKNIFCSGSVDGQQVPALSNKVTIDVWYPPSVPAVLVYNESFPWLENRTGILECQISDRGNPAASVTWASARGKIDVYSHLILENLTGSDNGLSVKCSLSNNFTVTKLLVVESMERDLEVEYTPEINFVPSQTSVTVIETRDLLVMCNTRGNPTPSVQWLNRSQSGNILYIQNVSRHDSGTYICMAKSRSTNYGRIPLQSQKQLKVTVQFAPEMSVKVEPHIVEVNSEVRIECSAQGEPSNYKFYDWIHKLGNNEVRHIKGILANQSISWISFPSITIADMGTYICLVDNSITGPDGSIVQSMEAQINVVGVPVAFDRDSVFIGETNRSSSIQVPFFSNPLITTLKFFKTWNNAPIANDTDTQVYFTEANISTVFYNTNVVLQGMVAIFHFRILKESDFGQYTLVLYNNKGTATLSVHLQALAPPSPVEQFYFYKLVGQYMEFFFVPGFNGGHQQTFTIQFKPSGSLDESWKNTSINGLSEMDERYRLPNGTFLVPVETLQPGRYVFRMFSVNKKNIRMYSQEISVYIQEEPHTEADIQPSIAGIAGGIGGGVVAILVTGVVIFLWRRHSHANKAAAGTACIPTAVDYEALQATRNEGSLYQELSDIKSCADTKNSFRMNGTNTTENQPTYINTKETSCNT